MEGFMVNQHSKSITKPKFELQLNLAFNMTFYQQVLFIQKDSYANYLSYDTLGTFVAFMGGQNWLMFSNFVLDGISSQCNLIPISRFMLVERY